MRQRVVDDFVQQVDSLCRRRGIECAAEVRHTAPAVACDPGMVQALQSACIRSQQARVVFQRRQPQDSCYASQARKWRLLEA